MATAKQIAANRRNAKKSTGPRTADGKARSRANAITHGVTGSHVVYRCESAEEIQELMNDLVAEFRPVRRTEFMMVEQLGVLLWRLDRVALFESQYMNWVLHTQTLEYDAVAYATTTPACARINVRKLPGVISPDCENYNSILGGHMLGRMVEGLFSEADVFNKICRYESHIRRQIERTRAQLNKLIEERLNSHVIRTWAETTEKVCDGDDEGGEAGGGDASSGSASA